MRIARTSISSRSFEWRDLQDAFSLAVDTWGFSLIEFDTAQLRAEDFPALGLLTQRFGVSVGLRTSLDLAALAPGDAVSALESLRERCEEALAGYAIVSARSGGENDGPRIANILAAVLPGYEAAGVDLHVEGVPSGTQLGTAEG